MPIIDNENQIREIEMGLNLIEKAESDPLIQEPFAKDFSLRFCWSSNAIEGNTLNLEETVSVIEYDEVRSGHTYSEYHEAKNLYQAISQLLVPFKKQEITEDWVKDANGIILGKKSDYRESPVYIGTLVEAIFYPPDYEEIPALMKQFIADIPYEGNSVKEVLERAAEFHIRFERIHPFQDGNGRVGRMILNQQLINHGLLPLAIEPKGKYRQAFRQYDKNKDISLMTYTLCKGEMESINKIQELVKKRNQQIKPVKKKEYVPKM
ncbi:Fic family protein [Muricomes intestini]|jgi:Fic family protein|uniref:Fic family protein n=1 Tax=Muricomes intestini TaxID=1796634 RepID=UPI000E95DF7B|nr:Fic family protein [Lachnospiraceae bacterium]